MEAGSDPQNILVMFHMDGVAQESDESFALELIPMPTTLRALFQRKHVVFFESTVYLTIIDSDCKYLLMPHLHISIEICKFPY